MTLARCGSDAVPDGRAVPAAADPRLEARTARELNEGERTGRRGGGDSVGASPVRIFFALAGRIQRRYTPLPETEYDKPSPRAGRWPTRGPSAKARARPRGRA